MTRTYFRFEDCRYTNGVDAVECYIGGFFGGIFRWMEYHPAISIIGGLLLFAAFMWWVMRWVMQPGDEAPLSRRTVATKDHYTTTSVHNIQTGKTSVPVATTNHHYRLVSDDGAEMRVEQEFWDLVQEGDPLVGGWEK